MNSDKRRKYKSLLDEEDKSTIQDTSGRALILHGGKMNEHNRLISAGFRSSCIDSVEIDTRKHHAFLQDAPFLVRQNAFNMNVHYFLKHRYRAYSYMHLDFNGHLLNSNNIHQIPTTFSDLPSGMDRDKVARFRITVSDFRVRNRNSKYASQERVWTRNILRWYFRNILDSPENPKIHMDYSPIMLVYLCLTSTFTLRISELRNILQGEDSSVNVNSLSRHVKLVRSESYCDMSNSKMYTAWFDIYPSRWQKISHGLKNASDLHNNILMLLPNELENGK